MTDPWPLRSLVLRTPRLELRPDDDEGLARTGRPGRRGGAPGRRRCRSSCRGPTPPDRGRRCCSTSGAARAAAVPGELDGQLPRPRSTARSMGTQGLKARTFAVAQRGLDGLVAGPGATRAAASAPRCALRCSRSPSTTSAPRGPVRRVRRQRPVARGVAAARLPHRRHRTGRPGGGWPRPTSGSCSIPKASSGPPGRSRRRASSRASGCSVRHEVAVRRPRAAHAAAWSCGPSTIRRCTS